MGGLHQKCPILSGRCSCNALSPKCYETQQRENPSGDAHLWRGGRESNPGIRRKTPRNSGVLSLRTRAHGVLMSARPRDRRHREAAQSSGPHRSSKRRNLNDLGENEFGRGTGGIGQPTRSSYGGSSRRKYLETERNRHRKIALGHTRGHILHRPQSDS